MGKVKKPLHQYNEEGGGTFTRKFEDGTREHTDIKGVPNMPAKGLYYPGADEPQTSGFYFQQKFVLIPELPETAEYMIKDINRIPETFVVDQGASPMQVVTNAVNLPELMNLLQNEYKTEFTVLRRKGLSSVLASLRSLARDLDQ